LTTALEERKLLLVEGKMSLKARLDKGAVGAQAVQEASRRVFMLGDRCPVYAYTSVVRPAGRPQFGSEEALAGVVQSTTCRIRSPRQKNTNFWN